MANLTLMNIYKFLYSKGLIISKYNTKPLEDNFFSGSITVGYKAGNKFCEESEKYQLDANLFVLVLTNQKGEVAVFEKEWRDNLIAQNPAFATEIMAKAKSDCVACESVLYMLDYSNNKCDGDAKKLHSEIAYCADVYNEVYKSLDHPEGIAPTL